VQGLTRYGCGRLEVGKWIMSGLVGGFVFWRMIVNGF
jgi:hypothetical protein